MTLHYSSTPARLRKTAVVGALAALTATIAIAPAHAAEGSAFEVATGAEYLTALAEASDSTTATTITLTADIQIPEDEYPEYVGSQDLTVDGAGHTVTPSASGINSRFLYIDAGDESNVTVTNITVQSFDSTNDVLYAYLGGSLTVNNARFLDNGAPELFGSVLETEIPTVVTNSEFSRNTGLSFGTAIDAGSSLIIQNSTLTDNATDGTVVEAYGDLRITNSTFSGNSAPDDAVVYADGYGPITVENSTFVNNESAVGVLAVEGASTIDVVHSTFANNTGINTDYAAHLAVWSDVNLLGNVFTGNVGSTGCGFDTTVSATTQYNFDADGSCTDGWVDETNIGEGLDAQLGALADNGGSTQTLLPAEGSPLIDAIPAQAGSPVVVDQRGIERPQGEGYDIGAVEVQVTADEDGTDAGVVTFQVETDGGTLYGTASAAVAVTDINWTSTANLTGAPANTALPYGAAGFTVEVPNPGDSVTITLTAPKPFTSAYKVTDGDWAKIDGATFSTDGTTVTYTLTDGGELDEDGEANGFIVDPIALAVQASFTG